MKVLIINQESVDGDLFARLEREEVTICRVAEIFGERVKMGKVAELCRKVAQWEAIKEDEPNEVVNLMYVGDVMEELRKVICEGYRDGGERCVVPAFYTRVWGEVVNLVWLFKKKLDAGEKVELKDGFEQKLYATFLSFCEGKIEVE